MRISTKGDYATRAMQHLALHYSEGPIQIEEIARRQHLPVRYLEQILLSLKRAGFLESKRGVSDIAPDGVRTCSRHESTNISPLTGWL